MTVIERLRRVADLARKVIERDGASARPDVIEWAGARAELARELGALKRRRKAQRERQ